MLEVVTTLVSMYDIIANKVMATKIAEDKARNEFMESLRKQGM